jgi:hypothetical protein
VPKRKARVAKPTRPKARARRKPAPDNSTKSAEALVPVAETAQEAVVRIAQDAVLILRLELAWRAEMSIKRPGLIKMEDLVALLRFAAELGATASKSEDGKAADYSRLTPEERAQLAALLLKVDYV